MGDDLNTGDEGLASKSDELSFSEAFYSVIEDLKNAAAIDYSGAISQVFEDLSNAKTVDEVSAVFWKAGEDIADTKLVTAITNGLLSVGEDIAATETVRAISDAIFPVLEDIAEALSVDDVIAVVDGIGEDNRSTEVGMEMYELASPIRETETAFGEKLASTDFVRAAYDAVFPITDGLGSAVPIVVSDFTEKLAGADYSESILSEEFNKEKTVSEPELVTEVDENLEQKMDVINKPELGFDP